MIACACAIHALRVDFCRYELTPLHTAGLGALRLLLDARDPELVMALLRGGALRHLEKAHAQAVSGGNLKAAEQVRSVLERLIGQMLDNYDALAAAGFECTLLNAVGVLGATDSEQGMAGAIQFVNGRAKGDGDELLAKLLQLPVEPRCPEGWKHLQTKEGKDYYVDDATGKSVWTPPLGFVSEADAQRARKFHNQIVDYLASVALHDPVHGLSTQQMRTLIAMFEARSGVVAHPDDHAVPIAMNALVALVANNAEFKALVLQSEKTAELLTRLVADEADEELSMHAMEAFQALSTGAAAGGDAALAVAARHFVEEHATVKALLAKIAAHEDHPLVVAQALTALYEFGILLGAAGLQRNGFNEAAYVLVGSVVDRHQADNEHIREDGNAVLALMQPLYPDVSRGAGQVSGDLKKCKDVINTGSTYVAVPYKDGRLYYVHSETKESTWEQPESYVECGFCSNQSERLKSAEGK
jgi:hypothetical protein